MNTNNFFGYMFAFLSGLVVGAIAALLLAPESGAELRTQIRDKADTSRQQIKADYEQARQWVAEEAGKLRQDKPADSASEIQ